MEYDKSLAVKYMYMYLEFTIKVCSGWKLVFRIKITKMFFLGANMLSG